MKAARSKGLLLLALLMRYTGAVSNAVPDPSNPLITCINAQHQGRVRGTNWATAMRDVPASLVAVQTWWSAKESLGALTIVTQMSTNRITQLWSQCKAWRGPLSAAILLQLHQATPGPLTTSNTRLLLQTLHAMSTIHQTIEADRHACKLDVILVYELYTERRAAMLYPVNQMRNLARLQARTELVALMDVDMLVSSSLMSSLLDPEQSALMRATCSQGRRVYVVPAFETYVAAGSSSGSAAAAAASSLKVAEQLSRNSKKHLVRHVAKGTAGPFASKRFPMGHKATDFQRWYKTKQQYEVKYSESFEPWIITNRFAVPWYDVRFRGYHRNKIAHVASLNASGFGFVVHPTGFLVHRPHEPSKASKQFADDRKRAYNLKQGSKHELHKRKHGKQSSAESTSNFRAATCSALLHEMEQETNFCHSQRVWTDAAAHMLRGNYHPVLDPATKHCLDVLTWWQAQGDSSDSSRSASDAT